MVDAAGTDGSQLTPHPLAPPHQVFPVVRPPAAVAQLGDVELVFPEEQRPAQVREEGVGVSAVQAPRLGRQRRQRGSGAAARGLVRVPIGLLAEQQERRLTACRQVRHARHVRVKEAALRRSLYHRAFELLAEKVRVRQRSYPARAGAADQEVRRRNATRRVSLDVGDGRSDLEVAGEVVAAQLGATIRARAGVPATLPDVVSQSGSAASSCWQGGRRVAHVAGAVRYVDLAPAAEIGVGVTVRVHLRVVAVVVPHTPRSWPQAAVAAMRHVPTVAVGLVAAFAAALDEDDVP